MSNVRPSSRATARAPHGVELRRSNTALSRENVLDDFRLVCRSRAVSVIGRREVLRGKAKFGVFGDGKEVPQVAMARAFRPGDWRAGYYRDQTFVLATGMLTSRQLFAQMYADTDIDREPASGGRQMNSHFATRLVHPDGGWVNQLERANSLAGSGAVSLEMACMLGLAYASKLYRHLDELHDAAAGFSRHGDEVVFGTIGNAAASEGLFFEAVNAAGVLQVPLLISVWDDEYGISVPNEYQMTKSSVSKALAGFEADEEGPGLDIYMARGWDYVELCDTYAVATEKARRDHRPALVHVVEVTQPLGHSTSGSHERYKSDDRLSWEEKHDCFRRMREWMIAENLAFADELATIEVEETRVVEAEHDAAFDAYIEPLRDEHRAAISTLEDVLEETDVPDLREIIADLRGAPEVNRRLLATAMADALIATRGARSPAKERLVSTYGDYREQNRVRYCSHLYSESERSPLAVHEEKPVYSADPEVVNGRVVLLRCFEHHFRTDSRIFVVGEDVGRLGDVNLVFEGLQDRYGPLRLTDTGIREATILGQAIGAAMRGLRPIADIQYIDYFLWALEVASDELAMLHYRTAGGQKAPVVIRTKGHRLMGIMHTGSPMATILHSCRGIYLCVPRDMTRAAGMYNTLFQGDNPGMVVEVLNAYQVKEAVPDNVGTFTVPLGVPETLREGRDVTVVTYGALCRIALDAAATLSELGVDVEVVDVQTLNPFDREHRIVESLRKTSAVLFLDEDVPGGASAFMMREVVEVQGGWHHLDVAPRTLTATENRSPYAADGDYFTKPNREDVIGVVYEMAREIRPSALPPIHLRA